MALWSQSIVSYRLRVFVRTSAGEIRRLPLAKFERFLDRDPDTTVPEFANKEMPIAVIMLTVENSRIVSAILESTLRIMVNRKGQVSKRWHDRLFCYSGEVYGAYMDELLQGTGRQQQNRVIAAEHKFLKRRLDEFHWKPTEGEIAEMVRLARLR